MKIRIVGISLLIPILILLFAGCLQENSDSSDLYRLIGTWEWISENEKNTYIFYENKSLYSSYINLETGETHKGWGVFEFNQNKLCMSTTHGHNGKNESYCYDYVFSQNNSKLVLSTTGLATVTLIKIST